MEQSGWIESDCKILVLISIQIQHGPYYFYFLGALGREHLSSSEVGRDRKSLRITALRPPWFEISSSWFSSGPDGLDSPGMFTNESPVYSFAGRGSLVVGKYRSNSFNKQRQVLVLQLENDGSVSSKVPVNIWNMSSVPLFARRPHSNAFIRQLENSCHLAGWICFKTHSLSLKCVASGTQIGFGAAAMNPNFKTPDNVFWMQNILFWGPLSEEDADVPDKRETFPVKYYLRLLSIKSRLWKVWCSSHEIINQTHWLGLQLTIILIID